MWGWITLGVVVLLGTGVFIAFMWGATFRG